MNIYDFEVKKMDGTITNLKEYENKVVMVVNTATHCGFTPQYTALEELYTEFKSRGFVILDFPCTNLRMKHRKKQMNYMIFVS